MPRHIGVQIAAARLEIEHGIGDALARPVIGPLPAAPGAVDRQQGGVGQIGILGAGSGGIERRVLQQPDQLAGAGMADSLDTRLHRRYRLGIGHRHRADPPFGAAVGTGRACYGHGDLLSAAPPGGNHDDVPLFAVVAELVDALA